MQTTKLIAIVMILVGALGLGYGGFSYTKETHRADVGSLHMSVKEKQDVNVPVWVGLGILVLGVVLLVVPAKN